MTTRTLSLRASICFIAVPALWAQSLGITLEARAGVPGTTVALNLSLSGGANAGRPAGTQFTLTYNPSEFTAVTVSPAAAATAAGKSLQCQARSGSVLCLLYGLNPAVMSDGPVAIVTATLSAVSGPAARPIGISGVMAVEASGVPIPTTGSGSTVVAIPVGLTLTCTPSTISQGAVSTCVVQSTIAAPAGGAVVTVASGSAGLTVPSTVTMPAGATSASFQATDNQHYDTTACDVVDVLHASDSGFGCDDDMHGSSLPNGPTQRNRIDLQQQQ